MTLLLGPGVELALDGVGVPGPAAAAAAAAAADEDEDAEVVVVEAEFVDADEDLGGIRVVTPAGLVFLLTFFVFGSLLSFLYFILRFWNQILICLSDKHNAWAISIRRLRVR